MTIDPNFSADTTQGTAIGNTSFSDHDARQTHDYRLGLKDALKVIVGCAEKATRISWDKPVVDALIFINELTLEIEKLN